MIFDVSLVLAIAGGPAVVDLSAPHPRRPEPARGPSVHELDDYLQPPPAEPTPRRGTIAEPIDDLTARRRLADMHDLPGNEYPRKHTVYMNFTGGDLMSGEDNSAENRSDLAENGAYPVFTGGEAKAVAAAQAFGSDVEPFGIEVVYLERPPQLLPYTMVMVGGTWEDTQLDGPAGGVAATADCGALNQRRVVYVFADGGWSAVEIASTSAQEAGHAWGLDHTYNCTSVMSYCLGPGDGTFSNTCDELCELDCQLPANCRVTHEMFCGAGNDQQNDVEELAWIFGTNAPDMEAPTVEILEPADGIEVPEMGSVDVVSDIADDYGGYAWKYVVERDGEIWYDQVAYDRGGDEEGHAFLQFANLQPGAYVFTIEVLDHAGQTASDSVSLTVLGGAADTTGTGDETGSADDSTGADDEDDGGDESSDDGGTQSDGGDDEGCGCTTSSPGGSAVGALALALLGLRTGGGRRR